MKNSTVQIFMSFQEKPNVHTLMDCISLILSLHLNVYTRYQSAS
jgi:hypothetical protein